MKIIESEGDIYFVEGAHIPIKIDDIEFIMKYYIDNQIIFSMKDGSENVMGFVDKHGEFDRRKCNRVFKFLEKVFPYLTKSLEERRAG